MSDLPDNNMNSPENKPEIKKPSKPRTKKKDSQVDIQSDTQSDTQSDNPQPQYVHVKDTPEVLINYLKGLDIKKTMEQKKELEDNLQRVYFKKEVSAKENANHIINIVGEFLDDFFLVGHTITGERIQIFQARSKKDKDALIEAIKQTAAPIVFTDM